MDAKIQAQEILKSLRNQAKPENLPGMARFGINVSTALGLSMPMIRQEARKYKRNHELALALWGLNVHELRILAALVDDPKQLTPTQMEAWVRDFNSWDLCDQVCSGLFQKSPYAFPKIKEWVQYNEEFIKRAGFVLMATMAVHHKKAPDAIFLNFLPLIEKGASDERNFVKKAVNWALRQIGKRNLRLHEAAIACGERLLEQPSKSARWIARDALRELENEKTVSRIKP